MKRQAKLTNAETIFHLAKSEVVQAVMKNLFSGKGANLAKKTNLGREPHLNIFYARYIGMLQIFCCKSA